jgi:transposase
LAVSKQSWLGAPTELNYAAIFCSLVVRLIDRIPTIKDLIKRLNHDFIFRIECGFLVPDQIPSEASYSRLIEKLSESNRIEKEKKSILLQAIGEGFVDDENVAFDASHRVCRNCRFT